MTFNRDWVLSVARRYATSMEDTGPALQQCLDEIDRLGREVAGAQIAIANWRLQTGCGTCFDAGRIINDLQGAVVEQTVRADEAEREVGVQQELLASMTESRDFWRAQAERCKAENAALRGALERIAGRGLAPRVRPTGEKWAEGCQTCLHWWDVGQAEHHDSNCAYIIASGALSLPSQDTAPAAPIGSLPGATQEAVEIFNRWKGSPYVCRDPERDPHLRGALYDVCIAGIVCGLHAAREGHMECHSEGKP